MTGDRLIIERDCEQLTARPAPLNAQQAGTKYVDRVGKPAASCRARSSTSTAMGYRRQLVTVEIPWGRPAIEPPQAVVHHPPNRSAPRTWTRSARVRALGAHRRATSQTGYPLDRTQHDLAGRLVAQKATLTRTRFRYGGQMTLDIRSMPFPKRQHTRRLRRERKGLLSYWGVGDDRSSAGCRRGQLL